MSQVTGAGTMCSNQPISFHPANAAFHEAQRAVASFGPFHLSPAARLIERDGLPLALGGRALDLLIVLVERAGEVVSHTELMRRVWRGLIVSPNNVRVHMTLLRKVLGDGVGSARYIQNVVAQGYCFVAPVRRRIVDPPEPAITQFTRVPALARILPCDETIEKMGRSHARQPGVDPGRDSLVVLDIPRRR
jgi:DNA-binding winged helix-turn-helix (wHTH) protein